MKTINIEDNLHKRLKIFCATFCHPINDVVTQALEESLAEYTKAERAKRGEG